MVGQHRRHLLPLFPLSLPQTLSQQPVETLTPCGRYLCVEDSLIERMDKALRF
jgi:hypothetical protein